MDQRINSCRESCQPPPIKSRLLLYSNKNTVFEYQYRNENQKTLVIFWSIILQETLTSIYMSCGIDLLHKSLIIAYES